MKYVRKNFPTNKITLVSDLVNNEALALRVGVNFWLASNPKIVWSNQFEALGKSSKYRNGFWFNTKARFLSLDEYMQKNNAGPIIHLEGDVWLAPYFPFGAFLALEELIAYPITNRTSGIASTLYLRNSEASKLLCDFSASFASTKWDASDVEILGALKDTFPSLVRLLKSAPEDQTLIREDSLLPKLSEIMTREIFETRGIFDGSSFGIHLLGEDPRNNFGHKKLFGKLANHSVEVSKVDFRVQKNVLEIFEKDSHIPIYSLHVHSKDTSMFKFDSWEKTILRKLKKRQNGQSSEFIIKSFALFVLDYTKISINYLKRKLITHE